MGSPNFPLPEARPRFEDAPPRPTAHSAWPRASRRERLVQAGVALAAWVLLAVAWSLTPAAEGVGTHTQLGLAPCTFHQVTDRPCPGCGMTTCFSHMVHGQVVSGIATQPFGAVLFAIVVLLALGGGVSALKGVSWLPVLYHPRLVLVLYGLIVLWLASWGYKLLVTSAG